MARLGHSVLYFLLLFREVLFCLNLISRSAEGMRGVSLGPDGETMSCVVPCPACSHSYFPLPTRDSARVVTENSKFFGPDIGSSKPHFFSLSELAGLLAYRKEATCKHTQTKILLADLIPDLMFSDLPRDKVIDRVVDLPAEPVAAGGYGTVYEHRLSGKDVAVKVYMSSTKLRQQKEQLQHLDSSDLELLNTIPTNVPSGQQLTELASVSAVQCKYRLGMLSSNLKAG